MPGAVDSRDAPRWFAAGDLFCAPSLFGEGFGIVLLEAMATGRPVVAADNAGYSAVLSDGTGQRLVRRGDADQLAAVLRELVLDADLRRRMAAEGRAAVVRYDVATLAPRFIAFYEDALSKSRPLVKLAGGAEKL